jgi:Uma2 family endonuclease
MAVQIERRRFTAEEFERLAEAGILAEDERVELINGEIVQMSPIGRRHAAGVARIGDLFAERLRRRALVWVQNPVHLGPDQAPQPDVALLRRRADYYRASAPGPADILLVVEVADTSAEYDREVKLPLYGQAGVAEAWLVDLSADRLLVARQPAPDGYRTVAVLGRGEQVVPLAFPDLALPVADLLG